MSSVKDQSGRRYWRSLNELADTPEFREALAREFPAGATELLSEPTRRGFLRVMGASLALAGIGVTSCRWPQERIMPFSYRPEGYVPGEPQFYATAMELGGVATGLLVQSSDGRPTKVEGNPQHPYSFGTCNSWHLASILELYDPDRSQKVVQRPAGGGQGSVQDPGGFVTFATRHFALLRAQGGAGLALLTESTSSPSLAAARERFLEVFPQARWYTYEPTGNDNERAGAVAAFGLPYRTHYDLTQSDVVLALDSDFLSRHPAELRYGRDWASRRLPNGRPMLRLYSVEGGLSLSGAQADHRLPLRSSQIGGFLAALASQLGSQGVSLPAGAAELVSSSSPLDADGQAFVRVLASDLLASRGSCLITVGPSQPPAVHALAHALNAALGNVGSTVSYTQDAEPWRGGYTDEIKALSAEMHRGTVSTLIVLGGNPAYNAPADLDFAGGLRKVEHSIHLSLHDDETSQLCAWQLPRTHYLEAWGDARAFDGTISVVQPLIAPLYESWTSLELLSVVIDEAPRAAYDLVRETLRPSIGGDFEDGWRSVLASGLIADSTFPSATPAFRGSPGMTLTRALISSENGLELELVSDYSVYDGRFANNGWLQELPDPVSKLTWDNALYIGVETAADLHLEDKQMARINAGEGREIDVAVMIVPGVAHGHGQLALGYGRRESGRVASGVGFDAYAIRTSDSPTLLGVEVRGTSRKYKLATTQDHFAIDLVGLKERDRRVNDLVREMTLADFEANPTFAQEMVHHPPLVQLWNQPVEFAGHKWGMAIDLNVCTGCSVCITACVSENNIPVVGKKEVARGREMHWIRVDRYFQGDAINPSVAAQPMTCHHCDNAPCEQVCPVGATVQSEEGLNQMVYNRCIGTRYCSNNCPYKVRKFNYFAYNRKLKPVEMMAMNPEVTVRSRGVMEKCTFCVQRIQQVKIRARNDGRPIVDGEITPACAQACPTQAIKFGDLNDSNSRVAKAFEDGRSYGMLMELNTRPRLHYLARVRNVHSELSHQPERPAAGKQEAGH